MVDAYGIFDTIYGIARLAASTSPGILYDHFIGGVARLNYLLTWTVWWNAVKCWLPGKFKLDFGAPPLLALVTSAGLNRATVQESLVGGDSRCSRNKRSLHLIACPTTLSLPLRLHLPAGRYKPT
jgi:hypothetical protein